MAEIAVSICIQVLKKTTNIVADLIVKEGSRFSRIQEEISWVEREMRLIQAYLKDVEYKQGESERVVNLMTIIRDLAFDVEDTMEKYFPIPFTKKGFWGFLERTPHLFSDSYSTRNFLVEIEAIKRRVGDINRARLTYGITERNDQVGDYERDRWEERRSFPHVNEPNVTGFGDHIRKLIAKIQVEDPRLKVVSVIGMAGLGKTTLAKKVYNSVRHSIILTAWVYVSEKPKVKNILQDIARQVGLQVDRWEETGEAILFERLSQHRDVGVHVGGWGSLFVLQPLEERYSKQLFDNSMGSPQSENDTPDLQKIGQIILHRCGGVPLAIVVVAGLLKLKERSESAWNGVLRQMDQAQGL